MVGIPKWNKEILPKKTNKHALTTDIVFALNYNDFLKILKKNNKINKD